MVVKGRKSRKGVRLGKVRKRGVGGVVGKKRLMENDIMMLEGGYAFELRGKNAKQLIGNLVQKDGGWENDNVMIVKEGGVERVMIGGEKMEEVVNLVTEEEEECDADMELMGGGAGDVDGFEDSRHAAEGDEVKKWKREFVSAREVLGESKKKRGTRREEFIVWENVDGEGEGGLIEDLKLKKKIDEKRKKEEGLRREKEGEYDRGKEMEHEEGRSLKREEALGDSTDVSMRRLERLSQELFDRMREVGKGEKDGQGKEEEIKRERKEKMGELGKMEAVEGGRSYKEVEYRVWVGVKGKEILELEKKKEKEKRHEEKRLRRKEEKEIMSVEVVLDSQWEGESSWNRSEWEEEFGLEKERLKEVKRKGDRVRVVVSAKEDLEKGIETGGEKLDGLLKGKTKEVRRMDKWCRLVVGGIELDIWEGKMDEFRGNFELENRVKLMKEPRWLVEQNEEKKMRMK
ncbi:hypothetical protein HOY80DRAFT_996925 [Tuber brumale]|nr:hypothetical protein HOY80DRAFT_996925 [Tuber brumale]